MKDPLQIALHFLKFRPRTEFEVRKKLQSDRFEDRKIKETIAVLKKNKLLDDSEFAKMWVRDRNKFKPSGAYLLKLELKKLGIAETDIINALQDQDEEEMAKKAIASKGKYRQAEFEKKVAFLQRRGFSPSIIYKVLKHKEGF